MCRAGRIVFSLVAALAIAAGGGCVKRTITIMSEPSGALVYLNDREVGRTPVEVEFLHYGTYDVRLLLDGHEPLWTTGNARPPLWDLPGPDLLAELAPFQLARDIVWRYDLVPENNDPDQLLDRARDLRARGAAPPN